MGWHALFVETGKEELVRNLINKRFEKSILYAIVPKRKLQERKQGVNYEVCRPIFPGYVLVKSHMTAQTYQMLKCIPRYYRLLNKYSRYDRIHLEREGTRVAGMQEKYHDFESYLFSEIREEEVGCILTMMDKEDIIGYSSLYVDGPEFVVHEGPLKGMEDKIRKINKRKGRAQLVLKFMDTDKSLDVGIKILNDYEKGNNNI